MAHVAYAYNRLLRMFREALRAAGHAFQLVNPERTSDAPPQICANGQSGYFRKDCRLRRPVKLEAIARTLLVYYWVGPTHRGAPSANTPNKIKRRRDGLVSAFNIPNRMLTARRRPIPLLHLHYILTHRPSGHRIGSLTVLTPPQLRAIC